jgi:lipopolysaccharide transport system ATP-binding protein
MISADKNTMLEMRDVFLNYHSRKDTFDHGVHHVLNGVSLKVNEGETLGVIGRNGCGKTTVLRVMAGILAPDRGVVLRKPGSYASLLTIGLGFKPNLSGRDNAMLSAMLQGASREKAKSYLDEIKEFSELGDSFEEPVKTYSSGMRSRLGFTTALMTHVDILLLDEVLSVGDAHFKEKASAAMKARITGDQTVVFVSHSAGQIQEICSRAVWLRNGEIADDGQPSEVLSSYRQFLNSMKT